MAILLYISNGHCKGNRRLASFEADTEAVIRSFQANEASNDVDYMLLAKRIKLR